jgi:hypothetical protein
MATKGGSEAIKTPAEQAKIRHASQARRKSKASKGIKGKPLFEEIRDDRRNQSRLTFSERQNFLRQRFFTNSWIHIQRAGQRSKWSESDMLEAKALYAELVYGEIAEYGPSSLQVYTEVTVRFAWAVILDKGKTPFMHGQSFRGFQADCEAATLRFSKSSMVLQDA